jgi:hypothetical protein
MLKLRNGVVVDNDIVADNPIVAEDQSGRQRWKNNQNDVYLIKRSNQNCTVYPGQSHVT